MSLTHSFPAPETLPIITKNRSRLYQTPIGLLPSVTTILQVLGLSKGALIAWSAREERKACLEAAAEVYAEGKHEDGPAGFASAVEARIGHAKQHQKQLQAAGEIGTAIHEAIRAYLNGLIDPDRRGIQEKALADQVLWGFMAFEDWWKGSGLRAVLTEQPVYREWVGHGGYGGTVDLLALDTQGDLGIVDFKTGKGIYDEHHLQVAAYWKAAESWGPISWATIVRLPKNINDPAFEVKDLGVMYDSKMNLEQLYQTFCAAGVIHSLLVMK